MFSSSNWTALMTLWKNFSTSRFDLTSSFPNHKLDIFEAQAWTYTLRYFQHISQPARPHTHSYTNIEDWQYLPEGGALPSLTLVVISAKLLSGSILHPNAQIHTSTHAHTCVSQGRTGFPKGSTCCHTHQGAVLLLAVSTSSLLSMSPHTQETHCGY